MGHTRIVLVEDHAILREGLRALIEMESDLRIVGEFASVPEGLDGIRETQPDLVVTDLAFRDLSGFELLAQIKTVAPRTRKLVLSQHCTEAHIRTALDAGADGYVIKDANRAELLLAIRMVSAGATYLSKIPRVKVIPDHGDPAAVDEPPASNSLTEREREILIRIARGEQNKSIARELALSVKTVEKHRSNLMRKLQLHNTASLTLYAVRNGLSHESNPANQAPSSIRRGPTLVP